MVSTVNVSSFDNALIYNGMILIFSFTYPEHILDMESTWLMPVQKNSDVGKIDFIIKIVNFIFLRFGSQSYK